MGDAKGGVEFPLNCFFGQMGVAPSPALARSPPSDPARTEVTLDNKDLAPGSVVYFKVNVPGAMFSAGDGHARRATATCVTALETSMHGRFRLTVLKAGADRGGADRGGGAGHVGLVDGTLDVSRDPRRPTLGGDALAPRHDGVSRIPRRRRAGHSARYGRWLHAIVPAGSVTETELYRAASLVADMRVTQVVNVKKGIPAVSEGGVGRVRLR